MPDYIAPSGLILLRVIGALILFSIAYLLFVREEIQRKDIFRFALCGIFGIAVNQLLFFEGLNLSTPINGAIVMTCNPILVIVLSTFLLKESITINKILGIIIGISGVLILILKQGDVEFSSEYQLGNLLIFINASSYALYLVLVKPLMKKYKTITIMFYVFSFGLLFVLPFGYTELNKVNWLDMPTAIYWDILFVVCCTTFIAYLFNAFALQHLNPTTVSIYIYLQPVLATLFAIFRKSDQLDAIKILATTLIFIGVWFVSFSNNKKQGKFPKFATKESV